MPHVWVRSGRGLTCAAAGLQDWVKDQPVTAENAGWRLHTRCERETLSRFPRSGAILFTIRTHLRKLDHHASHPTRVRPAARLLPHKR